MKRLLKKIARFILADNVPHVTVNIAQIIIGGILRDKRIVITGGSRGIGYSMAQKFITEGAKVLIVGRKEENLLTAVKTLGERCSYIAFDVAQVEKSEKFFNDCWEKMGGVDCFVSNAGISLHEGTFNNVSIDGFDSQFNINFRAPYFLCQSFLKKKLSEGSGGSLLLTSSETSYKCIDIPYGMTKAAINSLTGALGRRVYKHGIRVNAIAPGVTATDMTSSYTHANEGNYGAGGHIGRIFLPEEIAEVACFLLSDASKCINGEVIACDAGGHLAVNFPEID